MGRLRLWAMRLSGGALIALAAAAVAGFFWLRTSLPQTEGTLAVPGLEAPATVARDDRGIPFIRAQSERDAYFAMGFVHAQDRLWQMEVERRTGEGRLSEVFGERTLGADKFLRTLGIARAAEADWEHLDAPTKDAYEAYAQGVNAYLETRSGPLPLPFLLLGITPEPWRPLDSLVWIKMMAWDLGGNWDEEWLRARLAQRLLPARVAELFPPYPPDGPVTLPDAARLAGRSPALVPPALRTRSTDGLGSNAWAVAASRSTSGKPLLANDPHLSLNAPSQWYLASLAWPGTAVAGATLPGLPAPVLGRNTRIAWGFTNTNPDVQDLFVERLDPEDPSCYLAPEGPLPFAIREETIAVKGGAPVTLQVRETRHGPVISDLLERGPLEEDEALAFSWTALAKDDRTAQAGLKLAKAQNWESFLAALEDFDAPEQNVVYADTAGNIGFFAPGRVPIRAAGDGFWPAPGWDGSRDWRSFVPFGELPHAFNPARGEIVTANNKLVPDGYPYFITRDWAPPYRAERIESLLAARPRHSPETFAAIQSDIRSGMAEALLPPMLAKAAPASALERAALERLAKWDFVMAADAPEPLLFAAWERALVRALFADELGADFGDFWETRPVLVARVLANDEAWCDEATTPEQETCADAVNRALGDALAELSRTYGADIARWRWGEAHEAVMRHKVLSEIPLIGSWLAVRLPNGGGAYTVDVAGYTVKDEAQPFAQRTAPGYRGIYDMADDGGFLAIQNLGQSENPFSPHYRDLAPLWHDGRYVRVPLGMPAPDASVLRLVPKATP